MRLITYVEKNMNPVREVVIGLGDYAVTVGGEQSMPFYSFDASSPHVPMIAFEISPVEPDWPDLLKDCWGKIWNDPLLWACRCIEEYGAGLICVDLSSAKNDENPDFLKCLIEGTQNIVEKVSVPCIVYGTGIARIDNIILPEISDKTKGKNILIGPVLQENYKLIMASALQNSHLLIAQSPVDINIAKQLNIMLSDDGFPLERLCMDPTTGSLGYGLEYTYSLMERARLAALNGDNVLAVPFINFAGMESWRTGECQKIGYMWEAITALTLLQAGSDILVMRHPEAIKLVKKMIENITETRQATARE